MEDITMGGIIGIVGETDVAPLLVESLARLEIGEVGRVD
jgi:glucosamine 6-phosphate synthetase-like amidotransferase/phosphosugar isomerase protein